MSDTVRMNVPNAVERPARRIEIFTGAGRRRKWPTEDKVAIVAESYNSNETVCAVARRHGLTPAQLFAWRRAANRARMQGDDSALLRFVPAVAEDPKSEVGEREPRSAKRSDRELGIIEVEICGVIVRVRRGAEAKAITAVIRALKAGS